MSYIKPYELHLGDCLERMKEIPDGSVDMVLTSPPYDDLRTYNQASSWKQNTWESTLCEIKRLLKVGGVCVWVVNDATKNGSETGTSFKQALFAMSIGLKLHDTMIYQKSDYMPLTHSRYEQSFEYMFVFVKGKLTTFNGLKDKKNVGFGRKITGTWRSRNGETISKSGANIKEVSEFGLRPNIWEYCTAKGKKEHSHPAVFPLDLARDHIISWSNEGETILDMFMGSGTTGVACMNTGRRFIGIEMDAGYFQIAQNRISEAYKTKAP